MRAPVPVWRPPVSGLLAGLGLWLILAWLITSCTPNEPQASGSVTVVRDEVVPDTVTISTADSVRFCLFVALSDSTTAMRTTDFGRCDSLYLATYPDARRRVSRVGQAVADAE